MEYEELLRTTAEMLEGTRGNYDNLRFDKTILVLEDVAKLYADHLGLDAGGAGKLSYLLQSVTLAR